MIDLTALSDEDLATLRAHDAYQKGERVTFDGELWESLIDGNVWSPTAHPAGWRQIT